MLPAKTLWPPKGVLKLDGWLALFSVFSTALGFIIAGVSDITLLTRLGIIIVAFILPTLCQVSWNIVQPSFKIIRDYNSVYKVAESANRDSEQMRLQFASIIQLLESLGLQSFAVSKTTLKDKLLLLVIDIGFSSHALGLDSEVIVFDKFNYEVLGQFRITEIAQSWYLAREVRITNPIWWGSLHEAAQSRSAANLDAIALLLPGRN